MKTDVYTKTMLTIIALALVYQCFGGRVTPVVQAQGEGPSAIRRWAYLEGWIDGNEVKHSFDKTALPVKCEK